MATVEKELRASIERHFDRQADTALSALDSAEYEQLLALINRELKRWVYEFELSGLVSELAGDRARRYDRQLAASWYERAQAAYADGMAYATGSGEGWHFRSLYDRVSGKLRRLKTSR